MPKYEVKTYQPRTIKQNKALHLYFTFLAETLNDAGLDIKKTLSPKIEIPWSSITVKELIWKQVLKAQLGKDSTKDMTTNEIDQVLSTITRYLGQQFGLMQEFPSIGTIMLKLEENKK